MSVGYDLAGIKSERVLEFIRGMTDARSHVERLRRQIPLGSRTARGSRLPDADLRHRHLEHLSRLPPGEIEQIIEFLLTELGLHCVIKFNPMLLGPVEGRQLLNEQLGYDDIRVPDSAFESDTTWDQAVAMMERLGRTADRLGLGLGVKFSNTLIVENTQGFLPASEPEVYLSGTPFTSWPCTWWAASGEPLATAFRSLLPPASTVTTFPTPWLSVWYPLPSAPICSRRVAMGDSRATMPSSVDG